MFKSVSSFLSILRKISSLLRVVVRDVFVFNDLEYRLNECGIEDFAMISFAWNKFDENLCEFGEIVVQVKFVFIRYVRCVAVSCLWDLSRQWRYSAFLCRCSMEFSMKATLYASQEVKIEYLQTQAPEQRLQLPIGTLTSRTANQQGT